MREVIIEGARSGAFDKSPLVNTAHPVLCPKCKHRQSIVLLKYLLTGEFEIGKAEQIEVLITEGVIDFLEKETFTPIVVRPICEGCGASFDVKLVNVEYLKVIIDRPNVSNTLYA